jgi:hypothetical protein
MRDNTLHALAACVDCGFFLANGEPDEAAPEWSPELIEANWPRSEWVLVNGDSDDDECFSWSPCACCGSRLGGTRVARLRLAPRTTFRLTRCNG